jgi:glycosyltransferase involved in cell wall biosynthesis
VHVLFVHRNFPAQFGHIAAHLAEDRGWRATFVSERPAGQVDGIELIQYTPRGAATKRGHYLARGFENAVWHAAAVWDALKPFEATLQPDLIVGHSGFGSTLYLRELFPDAAMIGYFEWYYRAHGSDLDFRPEQRVRDYDRLRAASRNAMILLDLEQCDAGYSPTEFQLSVMPQTYRPKLRVLHDGIDTGFWRRHELPERRLGNLRLEPGRRLVTYVSRGLESMRGFDIFMKAAKRICETRDDVVFVVVGEDRVAYGGDLDRIDERSFMQHVLAEDDYDLSRINFVGTVEPAVLAQLLSLSDLHIYLTVPFVLSWSLLDAMACGCTILASDTEPVREVIEDGSNGLLCDFFDADALAAQALETLDDPALSRELGDQARATIQERYSTYVMLPRIVSFYEEILAQRR